MKTSSDPPSSEITPERVYVNRRTIMKAGLLAPTAGWKVEVGGLVHKPQDFDLDDLRRIAAAEERVYRMRCVEGWLMVIPWAGYSLSRLLDRVAPLGSAKYVAMQTLTDSRGSRRL